MAIFCAEKNKNPRDMPTPLIQYTFSGAWGKTQVLGTASDTGKTGLGAALKHGPLKTMGLDTTTKTPAGFQKSVKFQGMNETFPLKMLTANSKLA